MGVGFTLKGYSFDAIITARRPSFLRLYETLAKGGLDDPSNVLGLLNGTKYMILQ
jgi:hypothetical protein